MLPKILIIPARRHIIEAYTEYIIRYLGHKFYFEMGYPPVPPYENFEQRKHQLEISPFAKNPNDFDLIWPHFDTHWFLEPQQDFAYKIANVMLEAAGPRFKTAVAAGVTPEAEKHTRGHSVRFGVDTEMFKHYDMARTDNLLHVGFIGNIQTPRRYMKELFVDALKDVAGIRLMIFPTSWATHTRSDEITAMGGIEVIDSVVDGDKWYPGLPNLYNQMDVFVRVDIDHGCQFSVLEAASCEVPVVCTDSGNNKALCDDGGGICIDNGNSSWEKNNLDRIAGEVRQAVIKLRDNPTLRKEMGADGRRHVTWNYNWEDLIPAWEKFFQEGLNNASKTL